MKAIETTYKGYKFRSRLEARWAVFFDALGVSWEYELEGFEMERQWYLPDFWLNDFKCWVEIKPLDKWNARDPYYHLNPLWDLMNDFSNDIGPIICFGGMPDLHWNGMIFCLDSTDSSAGSYENLIGFAWCDICHKPSLSLSDQDSRFIYGGRTLRLPDWSEWNTFCDPQHRSSHLIGDHLDRAVIAARQARFEHGQSG